MKKVLYSVAALSILGFGGYLVSQNSNNKPVNKGNKSVNRIKTKSGLEYEIIHQGNGVAPKKGQTIKAHYTGWINVNGQPGTKFDSSVDRGEPLAFPVGIGYVIPGWDEGLMLMKVGDKFRFFIPSQLAYGTRGAGGVIKPNSDLIFDVELVSVG